MNADLKMNRPGTDADYEKLDPSDLINPPVPDAAGILMGLALAAKSIGLAYQLLGKEMTLVAFAEGVCRALFANGLTAGQVQEMLTSALARTATSIEEFNANKDGVRDAVCQIVEERDAERKFDQFAGLASNLVN